MTPDDILTSLDRTLSLRRRIGYVLLALAGLGGAGLIGLLWATEPGLPPRTAVAFAVLVAIGLSWAAFGAWALTRRVPLYARDRVVAGWIALAAWAVFALGVLIIAVWPALLVLVMAIGAVAVGNLVAARRHRDRLLRRRRELGGA